MSSSFTLYASARKYILDGTIDLLTDPIKVALVTSDYTPDVAHDVLADVMASPDPEVVAVASPDNGYTDGGETLTGKTVTSTDSPSAGKFDAEDLTWSALTATFRYGIMYAEKSVGSPAIVNPLIGYILFDTTPVDIVMTGLDFTIPWSPSGILTN
ncbi:MAG: hypothetical protein PHR28_10665 [candidate division Zixibacteria bacterium]|nr:hypothetical protein [candidate division Zixibacteria bacterium]